MEELINKLINQAYHDNINCFAAGGSIISNNKILIVKRADDDFLGGIYELPSGGIEIGESIIDGLKREVFEETNLEVKIKEYISYFDYKSATGKTKRQFNFILTPKNSNKLKLSNEHQDYVWITNIDIDNYEITKSVKDVIKNSFYYL
jgi:8-oxo-dGTP diphosphatase